jgi:hypothetical protein
VPALHKRVHVQMVARLAGDHDMRALLPAPAAVWRFAASRRHHALLIAHICLTMLVMVLRATLGLRGTAAGTAYCLFAFSLHFILFSTLMRRPLLVELFKSFELGYVLSATALMTLCTLRLDFEPSGSNYFTAESYGWSTDTRSAFALFAFERVSFNAIAALAILFNLLIGTVPNFPPRVFQLAQLVVLGGFVQNYVYCWQQRDDPNYPALPFAFLFLDTTVRQVAYSARVTTMFFLVKQLLKSLLKPQYSQLLHPRYTIREREPAALLSGAAMTET